MRIQILAFGFQSCHTYTSKVPNCCVNTARISTSYHNLVPVCLPTREVCTQMISASRVRTAELIHAAYGGPRVDAHRGRKFLQAEPGAGLASGHLKGYAFGEHIDWQLEVFG